MLIFKIYFPVFNFIDFSSNFFDIFSYIILDLICHPWFLGFSGGTSGKEPTCQCRRHKFSPCVGKIPWRRAWPPTPVFLSGESMDRRAWWAAVHRVAKELDTTSQLNNKSERGKQIPHINIQYCIYMGSGKILLTNLFARLKQRHRCQEQTCGHGGKEWGRKLGE